MFPTLRMFEWTAVGGVVLVLLLSALVRPARKAGADSGGLPRLQETARARVAAALAVDVPDEALGAAFSPDGTTFRLWAPTATAVKLLLFKGPRTPEADATDMVRSPQGVWSARVEGNLHNRYYLYEIHLPEDGFSEPPRPVTYRVNDPYATGAAANSGRSLVFDPAATDPPGWEKDRPVKLARPTNAVIYEMHVRDFSIHPSSGVPAATRGKYLGVVQAGARSPGGAATSLDHLAELGVTHVHLLPVFDYGTGDETEPADRYSWFNWGYDPVLYNCPEGSYASSPDGIARQREFKEMVMALHRHGIGVVLDCVFNHTFQTGGAPFSVFDKVFPGYFYRQDPDGTYANGSGCLNEVASERPMARRFILDSIRYWLREYHVDGFRFDLMGLHDTGTMRALAAEAKKINPSVLLYGEGWDMGQILPPEQRMMQRNVPGSGLAAFNDGIRDNLKGDVFDARSAGFVQGAGPWLGLERLKQQLMGASTGRGADGIPVGAPGETVNYVSCHDNLCLMDKLAATLPDATISERLRRARLALAMVITAQGIPFLHLGDEFGRDKNGVENSFNNNDPAVNPVDWSLKTENRSQFDYVRGLLWLRREHPAFRMTSAAMVQKHMVFLEGLSENVVGFVLKDHANEDRWRRILVVYNGTAETRVLPVPGKWRVVADGDKAGPATLYTSLRKVTVAPFAPLVAYEPIAWEKISPRKPPEP